MRAVAPTALKGLCVSYLIAVHHEVVGGNKGFEDHHPAGVGSAFKKRVRQLGNVHVHLIGAVDQIWFIKRQKQSNSSKEQIKQSILISILVISRS